LDISSSAEAVRENELKIGPDLRGERAADAVEAGLGGFLEGVWPDADDAPSSTPELAGDAQKKMSSAVDQIRPASRSRVRNSDGSIIGMP
jgi:hypothetical protein